MDVKKSVLFELFRAKALAVKQKVIPLHPHFRVENAAAN